MSGRVKAIASFELDPKKPVLSAKFKEIQEKNIDNPDHVFHLMTVQEAARHNFSMIAPGSVGWYHGSPVCSNLSVVNRSSLGETEIDISNVNSFTQGISAFDPRVVTVEQVPAFKEVLETNGYDYHWQVVNMSNYGVAQDRRRYWLLAWKTGDRPWLFPAPCRRLGWWEVAGDIPFKPLPLEKVLDIQKLAIAVHQHHYRSDTFMVERSPGGSKAQVRTQYQPSPTIIKQIFTDKKSKSNPNTIVSRHLFMDAMINGNMVSMTLDHIRRICGFPDWFQAPNIPGITGVGYGYACTPEFVRLLAETNLA
jgi:site-specific DNA-cytosine methylase